MSILEAMLKMSKLIIYTDNLWSRVEVMMDLAADIMDYTAQHLQ